MAKTSKPDAIQIGIRAVLEDTMGPVEGWHGSNDLREDLNFDSLDHVELAMGLEEKFSIEIEDNDAWKWKTLGDVEAYLRKVVPPCQQ